MALSSLEERRAGRRVEKLSAPAEAAPPQGGSRPVSAKISEAAFDILTALALVDSTNLADQIRTGLNRYFAERLADTNLPSRINMTRSRHEEILAVVLPDGAPTTPVHVPPVLVEKSVGSHPITLRIDERLFDLLVAFAMIDNTDLADQLRASADAYIGWRTSDPELISQVEEAQRRHQEVLSALASGNPRPH